MSAKTAELAKNSKKFGGPSEPITLNIANRLFAQKSYHFRETFLSLVKQNFGGAFEPLDFIANPAAATQRINKRGGGPDARSNSRSDSRRRAG
jgi:serine protease inhibitor